MPIKFRCYQCSQLLGVSRSRSGKTVNCPKCGAGLVVPDAGDVPAGDQPAATEAPGMLAALDSGIPIELADIRPEAALQARSALLAANSTDGDKLCEARCRPSLLSSQETARLGRD